VATAATGTEAKPHAAGKALSGTVLIGSYRTADQRWLSLNMLDQERHWEPTCRALGLEGLLEDPACATVESRAANVAVLHDRFSATIAARPLAEWRTRLAAEDTIWSTMASPNEVIADPQVEANGYLPRVPGHPSARLSSGPMQFDGTGLEIRRRAPDVGEHTDEVFRELGLDDGEVAQLRSAGALA
jgi:formyl-CoA transferase